MTVTLRVRSAFGTLPSHFAAQPLSRGRVRMTVTLRISSASGTLPPHFAAQPLSRGRVRIIRDFRKQVSKISSMLTLLTRKKGTSADVP